LAAAAAIIIGILAAYEFYWNVPEPVSNQPVAVPSPAPEVGTAAAGVQTVAVSSQTHAPAQSGTQTAAAQPAAPAITVATAPQPIQDARPAVEEARPEGVRMPGPGEHQVQLVFDQESWVEIRDRNERVIFSQLNPAGTRQLVSGLPPFSIVVGNAQGVRMTYGDKPVDLARHTRTDVARLILQ
jgi:cytoskeleton protein RodZ